MANKADGFWQEVTDWDIPNHTYMLKNGKCLGYIKNGTDELIEFSKPLFFDGKRRKFNKIRALT